MTDNIPQKNCLHNFIDPTLHQQLVLSSFLDFRSLHSKTHFPMNRNTLNSSVKRTFAFTRADAPIYFTQGAQQSLGSYPSFIKAFLGIHGPMVAELLAMIPLSAITGPFDWTSVSELNHLFDFGNVDIEELFQKNNLRDVMGVFSTPDLTLDGLKKSSLVSDQHLLALILFLCENTGFIFQNDIRTVAIGNALPNYNPFQGVKFELTPEHLTCIAGPVGYFLAYASSIHKVHDDIVKAVEKFKPDWPFR
jgi:hypothetical protein